MEMTNRLLKSAALALTMLAVPVYAQDVIRINFGHQGMGNDKRFHNLLVTFNYKSDCAELEKACAKFFFDDSVSTSLEAATKNYQEQFVTPKKLPNQTDVVHRLMLKMEDNSSGKYTSYLLGKSEETKDGTTQKKKSLTWNLVYDNMNDRLLTVDDIFVPSEAAKIKETIGKRRPQLFVTNSGVVWGYMVKGSLVQNKCLYKEKPEIYTEKFRKLIGGYAFDHDAIFANGSVDDYLRQNLKYPAEAQKNLEDGAAYFSFMVDADGSVKNVKMDDGIFSSNLEQEVIRVVSSMPRWTPAVKNGENVSSTQSISVGFPTDEAECDTLTNYLFARIMSNIVTEAKAQKKQKFDIVCVIEADGSASSIKIKGCNLSPKLKNQLAQVTKGAPKSIPAKMYDVPVRSQRTFPVTIDKDEIAIEVKKVKSSVMFTAPEIKKDDEAVGELLKAKEVRTQPTPPKVEPSKTFDVVEQMPSFGGGIVKRSVRQPDGTVKIVSTEVGPGPSGLFQYLSMSVRYPPVAEENGVQGRVIVSFVVERDGSITDVRVVKSVDPSLDKEAIRVISSMPKWIPGKQNGDPVRVKYTTPVTFRLQ